MFTARTKIRKAKGKQPDALEESVAQAIFDLEVNTAELKADLKDLYIVAAREVELPGSKKAVIVFVPFPQLKNFHRVQVRLVRELEKKFSGKHVVVIAQRRVIRKPSKNNRVRMQRRPMSRTLSAVHEAILEDLVYPTEIVGKRTRVRLDGSKLLKVFLDRKDQNSTEHKLDTFANVYKRLTGKEVVFEFPVVQETALSRLEKAEK
jgi:small subunit ribosomal protein S7e